MIIELVVVAVVEEAVDVVTEVLTEVALSVDVEVVELVDFFGLINMNSARHSNPLASFSCRSAFVFSISSLIFSGFPLTSFHLVEAYSFYLLFRGYTLCEVV